MGYGNAQRDGRASAKKRAKQGSLGRRQPKVAHLRCFDCGTEFEAPTYRDDLVIECPECESVDVQDAATEEVFNALSAD